MELDRPILQREKFELIFYEKINVQDQAENEKTQKSFDEPQKKKKIKVGDIPKLMNERMLQRKTDNMAQLEAYKQLCDYIKTRFQVDKITPTRLEVNFMEVIKKIVESGWIICSIEMQ